MRREAAPAAPCTLDLPAIYTATSRQQCVNGPRLQVRAMEKSSFANFSKPRVRAAQGCVLHPMWGLQTPLWSGMRAHRRQPGPVPPV